jgi:hypothetical protein
MRRESELSQGETVASINERAAKREQDVHASKSREV